MQYETFNRAWCRGGIGILAVGAIALVTLSSAADRPGVAAKPELTKLERSRVQVTRTDQQDETVSGKELFSREWLADDPRSKGGDGLGPVFNESSCVACHNLGGVGGAGSLSKNVELVTALSVNSRRFSNADSPNSTNPLPVGPRRSTNPRDELIRLHPGFREAQTVVLHRFGTNSGHEQWRANFFGNQSLFAPVAFGLNVNADRFSQVAEELAPNPVDDDFGTSDGEDSTGFAPDGSRAARAENSPFGDPAQQSGTTASSAPNQALPTAQPAPVRQVTPRPTTPQFQPPSEPSPRRPTQPPTQPPRQDPVDPFAPATQAPQVVRQQTTAQQAIPQPFPSSPAPARFGPVDQPSAAPNAVPTQSQRNPSQGTFAPPQIQQSIVSSSSQFPIVIEATRRIQQLKQQAQSGLTSQRTVARNAVQFSQRNTPALFGAGLIDAIPESALIAASKIKHEDSPRVSGRIARDKEGHVGRFGWKAQKTSLVEFTLAACAVELGLNVPGHAQAGVPYKPDHKSKGLDLNEKQLAALVDYLKNL
ncbi:MAG: hypothetical protein O3A00_26565, partial [Planctomycetota bacterium]|nr:hypothetical protein [Planctomycetota bacterium]